MEAIKLELPKSKTDFVRNTNMVVYTGGGARKYKFYVPNKNTYAFEAVIMPFPFMHKVTKQEAIEAAYIILEDYIEGNTNRSWRDDTFESKNADGVIRVGECKISLTYGLPL